MEVRNTTKHIKTRLQTRLFLSIIFGAKFLAFSRFGTHFGSSLGHPKSTKNAKNCQTNVFKKSLASKARVSSILHPFGWILGQKTPLGQIVPQTTSGTNRSKNNLSGTIRYTLYANIRYTLYAISYTLYAVRWKLYAIRYTLHAWRYTLYALRYTLYATRYTLYAIRHTPYAIRYTLYATNNLWDKSFQKQALGQIVPKTKSGTNRSTKSLWDKSFQKTEKRSNPFSPPSPFKKKGRACSPLAAQCARPPAGRKASRFALASPPDAPHQRCQFQL